MKRTQLRSNEARRPNGMTLRLQLAWRRDGQPQATRAAKPAPTPKTA
jgi:hypothetical protein